MDKIIENNKVAISGEIIGNFEFSHDVFGEGMYTSYISAERESGYKDIIRIMVSERLVDIKEDWNGKYVKITGQFRSYNRHEDNKNRLILYMFAREFEESERLPFSGDENDIFIDGYICKETVYRKTPLGREIGDLLIAVNRAYGKSDYIPCISWGRNARFSSKFKVGDRIQIHGRIQSREYKKKIGENEIEIRTAHEVSANTISLVNQEE